MEDGYEDQRDPASYRAGAVLGARRPDHEPFAATNARRSPPLDVNTTLEAAIDKLRGIAECYSNILVATGRQLEAHADRVHGEPPKATGSGAQGADSAPYYGDGLLGELFRTIDGLNDQLSGSCAYIGHQANRNCALA